MAVVKVKEKYQVTLPAEIRKKADLTVGDLLEAKVEGKKITLSPRRLLSTVSLLTNAWPKPRRILRKVGSPGPLRLPRLFSVRSIVKQRS